MHEVPHSSHWGAFTALVDADRMVGARPHPADADPSPMIDATADAVHARARVARPAVRRSWLEGGAGSRTDRRGAEEFVEVSWDRALDLVAGELDRVRTEHGNAAIFGGSYGWSSAGRFHHAQTQLHRFLNRIGGFTDQRHNYSYAAALALLPHVVGDAGIVSGTVTSWGRLKGETELWVAFGGLPLRTAQVESGGLSTHEGRARLSELVDTGTTIVNVSPLRDDVHDEVRAEWVPVRPTTDTALMLGIAHTLDREGLVDHAFVETRTRGYSRFRSYLLGERDGVPKDALWAEEICGVPAGEIESLARRMASSRTFLTATWSLQRAEHGEQPYWMLITLASMLGQIGLPGGGFSFGYGNTAGMGTLKTSFGAPALRAGPGAIDSWIPVARHVEMLERPGGEYEFDGERRVYPDIRLVYWAGGNPFHHHQDTNRLVAAWRRPETIIVHEPWWTATARHADIVLPATTSLERNDIGASSRDRVYLAMKQALPPQGEARNDVDIFAALARRLGVEHAFTEGRDEEAWLRHLYDVVRDRAAAHGVDMPRFDGFWEAGEASTGPARDGVLLEDFRRDPATHPLRTPSGLIEIFSETIAGFGYDDCPGHPVWIEPQEWGGAPDAARHPPHLLSNQPRTRLHSQLDMGRVSVASKVAGHEPIRMHPDDAAARGIAEGDVVVVTNDRGRALAGAALSDAVRPGVVVLSTGAWYDPESPGGLDRHGNPNVLTRDVGTSRLGQGPSAQSALVEVARYAGDAAPVRAHEPPAIAGR